MIEVSMHTSLYWMKEICASNFSGLRDFIGTGWYSSEYIVGTKSIEASQLQQGRFWPPS